jgi:hypothetical protein
LRDLVEGVPQILEKTFFFSNPTSPLRAAVRRRNGFFPLENRLFARVCDEVRLRRHEEQVIPAKRGTFSGG